MITAEEIKAIEAKTPEELLNIYTECRLELEDVYNLDTVTRIEFVRREIIRRMNGGKAKQESESELFEIYCQAHA